jgi:hypothetical protein
MAKLATHYLILTVIGATQGIAQMADLIGGANDEGHTSVRDGRLTCGLFLEDDHLWLPIGGCHRESEHQPSPH